MGSNPPPICENPLSMGLGRPVSRILLYPAIHLRERTPGLPGGAAPTSPAVAGTIWLARTGGLPGRSLAGYRRWALTPPFHPSPVPEDLRPSAGLLSVALDVAAGLRRAAPRVLSPSGLSGRGFRALASPDFALRTGLGGKNAATGRTAQTYPDIIPQGVPYGVTSPASGAGPGISRRRVVRVRSWSVSGAARLSGLRSSASASASRP